MNEENGNSIPLPANYGSNCYTIMWANVHRQGDAAYFPPGRSSGEPEPDRVSVSPGYIYIEPGVRLPEWITGLIERICGIEFGVDPNSSRTAVRHGRYRDGYFIPDEQIEAPAPKAGLCSAVRRLWRTLWGSGSQLEA